MNILQLTHMLPWPPIDGGKKGILGFVEGYRRHPAANAHTLVSMCHDTQIQSAQAWKPVGEAPVIDVMDARNRVLPFVTNTLFSPLPYNMAKYRRASFSRLVEASINRRLPDIVHFDGAHTASYAPLVRRLAPGALRVLRCHNAEHVILERFAAEQTNHVKRVLMSIQARRLKRYEALILNDFDLILAITAQDAERFRVINPQSVARTIILPAGAHIPAILPPAPPSSSPFRLLHVAAMDWLPNQAGLRWLLDEVVPLLDASGLHYHMDVVGKAMPQEFLARSSGHVQIHGFVEDLSALTAAAHIAVVPLHIGGGMRVKIADFWSQGIPVVATPVGAEGLADSDPPAVVVADSPADFAAAICRLCADSAARETLRHNAFIRVKRDFAWPLLIDRVIGEVHARRPDLA